MNMNLGPLFVHCAIIVYGASQVLALGFGLSKVLVFFMDEV